ncbi:hypothetical protein [Mesobacterium pallidum]|uniref:hypothetical protein n=1 Tax=Mesobacterium pallidum TaxID=2872037 RepID=UPI001EE2867F|nr:hypothetical protein [Mesobacterium pallidum]
MSVRAIAGFAVRGKVNALTAGGLAHSVREKVARGIFMQGWSLFTHSVTLVVRNWRDALKIGLVPIGLFFVWLMVAVGMGLSFANVTMGPGGMGGDMGGMGGAATPAGAGVAALLALLTVIFGLATFLWVVVSWHRFVLLEEYPRGWVPPFRGDLVLGYFGRLLLLLLLGFVLMIPVIVVASGFVAAMGEGGVMLLLLLAVPFYVFILVSYYRLAIILPAGAVGAPLTLGQAWVATRGSFGTIFVMQFGFFLMNLAVQMAVYVLSEVVPVLGLLVSLAATVFVGLVQVSLLTTLYGVYIEKRGIG